MAGELDFRLPVMADYAAILPGVERIGPLTVGFGADDGETFERTIEFWFGRRSGHAAAALRSDDDEGTRIVTQLCMIEPVMSRQPERLTATPSQTIGPFFHFGLAGNATLGSMAGPDAAGERVRLHVRVSDGDGLAVPDALVELWQADAKGRYSQPGAALIMHSKPPQSPTSPSHHCSWSAMAARPFK